MNAPRLSNPRRLAIFGALVLILSLLLLFSAQDLIHELVVLPLSYLFWAGQVFVITTPQVFFWGVLLFIAGLAAYRSLTGRPKVSVEGPLEHAEEGYANILQGQVAYWALRVNLLRQEQGRYFLNAFHLALGRILFDALCHRQRMTFQQVEQHLRDGTLDVPPEVGQYALHSLRRMDFEQEPFLTRTLHNARQRLYSLLDSLLGRGGKSPLPPRPASQDEQWIRQVIQYLEEELEVSNDDSGR